MPSGMGLWGQIIRSGKSPVQANITPSIVNFGAPSCPASTGFSCFANASEGTPPYTYAWSWQTGGVGIFIGSPTGASTTLTVAAPVEKTGLLKVVVTDADGDQVQDTVDVTAECGF